MNAIFIRFPEVYRCAMAEAKPAKLVMAGATSVLAGGCVLAAAAGSKDLGTALWQYAFHAQALILLVYGMSKCTASIMTERLQRTWDLQRLTPLTAWDIAAGKLLGAPIFAFFLAAVALPWAFAGFVLSGEVSLAKVLGDYILLACVALLGLSVGVLVSAYSDTQLGGASSGTAGGLLGLMLFNMFIVAEQVSVSTSSRPIPFYGLSLGQASFYAASSAVFGAWALAAAKWRIGRELMEPGRCWRLPAFLFFLIAYELGFGPKSPYAIFFLPCATVYFAAVLTPAPLDLWRKWLDQQTPQGRLDRAPVWLQGAAACLLAALLLQGLWPRLDTVSGVGEDRFPLLLAVFMIRDLSFLQWCRFTATRRPEVMAMVYLALAYVLPGMVALAFRGQIGQHWFSPIPKGDISMAANLLPGLVQAAAALYALSRSSRRAPASMR